MPVPTLISSISQTAGSNGPDGATEAPSSLDNYMRAYAGFIATLRDGQGFTQESTVASAATADIGSATSLYIQITGTTTITSFGTTYNGPRFVRFAGILTLTHNATTLILPGAANITTAAGDTAIIAPNGNAASGWRVLSYSRAALAPGVASTAAALSGTLGIAGGGTGQITAALAFGALKQDASDTATGVVELATTAEAAAGTDTARAITPAGLFGGLNATGTAPIYAARAWVNFNGTGTVAIRGSGNTSSITDNGTGDYTINLTTALPDANYTAVSMGGRNGATADSVVSYHASTTPTASALRIGTSNGVGTLEDHSFVSVSFFR